MAESVRWFRMMENCFNSLSEREQALLISVNDLIAYPVSVQTATGVRVA